MFRFTRSSLASTSYVREALAFPAIVFCCSIALAVVYACVVIEFGLHHNQDVFLGLVISIAFGSAGPVTVAAFFREHQRFQKGRELHSYATTDSLTGVLNRRAFESAVREEQDRIARSGQMAALILFDLDDFKTINDQFGHTAGDKVLKKISEISHSELRGPFDRLGRWGGEEFVILLNSVNPIQAHGVAERLRSKIASQTMQAGDEEICVTASFGFAMVNASTPISTLVSVADDALYRAKRNGKNMVVNGSELELVA